MVKQIADPFDRTPQDVARDLYGSIPEAERGRLQLTFRDGVLAGRQFRFTPLGLSIDENIAATDWESIGELLFGGIARAWNLWIGDFLAFGERKYGATYQAMAAATGYDVDTLYDLVWICKSVQISLRKENLALGHYRLVAALTVAEQSHWLDYASNYSLSVEALRTAIKRAQPAATPGVQGVEPSPLVQFERRFNAFESKLLTFARAVGQPERQAMAQALRALADRIDNSG